jgi:hypothetical protein
MLTWESHGRGTQSIIEAHVLLLMASIPPVLVAAWIAAWPFRSRPDDFTAPIRSRGPSIRRRVSMADRFRKWPS